MSRLETNNGQRRRAPYNTKSNNVRVVSGSRRSEDTQVLTV
jgi:hypothetical protein